MRLFGKKNHAGRNSGYKLLQIQPSGQVVQDRAIETLIDDIWAAIRSLPRLKFSPELPAYAGLEIQATQAKLNYFLWLPESIVSQISERLKLLYPAVIISAPPDDYSRHTNANQATCSGELVLTEDELLPITRLDSANQTERWLAILNLLGSVQASDQAWLQILMRPLDSSWKSKIYSRINKQGVTDASNQPKQRLWASKASYNGFRIKIRLIYTSQDQRTARRNLQTLAESFSSLNNPGSNGLKLKSASLSMERILEYHTRLFIDKGYLLNTAELASFIDIGEAGTATTSNVLLKSKTKPQSRFEELLAQAESQSPSDINTKFKMPPAVSLNKPKQPKRPARGVIGIVTKATAKKEIGKVATKKSQDSSQTDEVTVKLH